MTDERIPIAHLRAVVEIPIYEGDKTSNRTWEEFIYEEPGISDGHLAICRRPANTLSFEVIPA